MDDDFEVVAVVGLTPMEMGGVFVASLAERPDALMGALAVCEILRSMIETSLDMGESVDDPSSERQR